MDETDCRVTVWGVSAFLMKPYTRQFKKVPTLALALNFSCSALEFKWPACGFQPLCLCLCPSHGPSLCCCALFLMDFLSLFYSLLPLFSKHPSLAMKCKFLCWKTTRNHFYNIFCLGESEKSGKALKYFLFVLFLDMYVSQFCPKCITTYIRILFNLLQV